MSIVVGVPHGGAIKPEWLVAWERMQLPPDTAVLRAFREPVHLARNRIVASVLEQSPDATHLFFLDDDVLLPPDGLMRLLAVAHQHDLPLVTGLCTQRYAPFLPCVYHLAPDGHYVHITRFCQGLQEVDACGAACLLIRTDVLRALPAPWFAWDAAGFSEDMVLCRAARAAGYPILLNADVRCTHLGVLEATYERFKYEEHAGHVKFATADLAQLSATVRPFVPER